MSGVRVESEGGCVHCMCVNEEQCGCRGEGVHPGLHLYF